MIELVQLWHLLHGVVYYLPVHLLVFIVLPLLLRQFYARRYRTHHSLTDATVSVVVPQYMEDLAIFAQCIESIYDNDPDEIITIIDDGRYEALNIARLYAGDKSVSNCLLERKGKRAALVEGWNEASGDIIVHVDSDTVLRMNAIEEIVKPFDDPAVVGVQGKTLIGGEGGLSHTLATLIEYNRDLVNKALNGHLVVADGRFNAWRATWLKQQARALTNEYFLGRKCEIGDDRFLTHRANTQGFKVVYQDSAVAETVAPPTYRAFITQQLRWMRSGFKYFYQDLVRLIGTVSWRYLFHTATFYLGSVSFTLALLYDGLAAPPIHAVPLWATPLVVVFGVAAIELIRRVGAGYHHYSLKELALCGLSGLFIMYPMSLYALLTIRQQASWGTR